MLNLSALTSAREALSTLPVDCILWAFDARGVLQLYERQGAQPGVGSPAEMVGRRVWDLYRGEPSALAFLRRMLREPATAVLRFQAERFRVSGGPVAGGGAAGMALAIEAEAPPAATPRPHTIELRRPLPEVGASAGDLLIVDPAAPERIGVYRTLPLASLSPGVVGELAGLSRSAVGAARFAAPAGPRAPAPLRARAAHLRLLP